MNKNNLFFILICLELLLPVVPSVPSGQLGTSNEGFESHDSNNVRCGQIEYLITAFSERWLIDFGVADIARCLGRETHTFI
jgi:hypothetical protein